MSDLNLDTTITGGNGVYRGTLSRAWEIWGPMGGYLASFALRAAGEHCGLARPANLVGHFLGVANFDEPITITTTSLRIAKTAHSVRAEIRQGDHLLFTAMVWGVTDGLQGLAHNDAPMPDLPHWSTVPSIEERVAAMGETIHSVYPFWDNLEQRPPVWRDDWDSRVTGEEAPYWYEWLRFTPTPSFVDPWVDACRLLVLVDLGSWPATQAWHNSGDYIAPSIDLACEFHCIDPTADWLLARGHAPLARDGLIATEQHVWSGSGTLLASGISHLLCRPTKR